MKEIDLFEKGFLQGLVSTRCPIISWCYWMLLSIRPDAKTCLLLLFFNLTNRQMNLRIRHLGQNSLSHYFLGWSIFLSSSPRGRGKRNLLSISALTWLPLLWTSKDSKIKFFFKLYLRKKLPTQLFLPAGTNNEEGRRLEKIFSRRGSQKLVLEPF